MVFFNEHHFATVTLINYLIFITPFLFYTSGAPNLSIILTFVK